MLGTLRSESSMPHLTQVETARDVEIARALLREYERALGVDLCFQGFEQELKSLPGAYAPPSGLLLLAWNDEHALGCVALQRVDADRAEMKRLYVRPSARGLGLGRQFVTRVLDAARAIGYREVVLDTLPTMREAQHLYGQFGFEDIEPYRANPIIGSRYMGLRL